jgi:uncharacterized protein
VKPPAPRYEGFVPGRHVIDAYGAGGFKFAGMGHIGSILATPGGVTAISANTMAEVTVATFAPLLAELKASPSSVEFLVIGMGEKMSILPPLLGKRLRASGLRLETMATGPAARIYNVLIAENRRVAALLLAVP